jgi:putative membrane protein
MKRLRIVVMAAWGTGLCVLLAAGKYSLFIRAELWPLLLGTVVMFLLFLVSMFAVRGTSQRKGIRPAAWLQVGMLLLPLLYMFSTISGASASSGLNSFAFHKRSLGANAGFDSADTLTDASVKSATPDSPLQSIGYIAKHFRKMDGRHIITEGRSVKDESGADDQTTLYRFVVVCCAADAMPVQVVVRFPKDSSINASSIKEDCWLRVEGTLHSADQGSGPVPVIEASRVKEITAPAEPYLSPYRW